MLGSFESSEPRYLVQCTIMGLPLKRAWRHCELALEDDSHVFRLLEACLRGETGQIQLRNRESTPPW